MPKNLETIAFSDFEFGSNKIVEPAYGVSSSHRMNGILIAHGPAIAAQASIEPSSLIDLAPTILHLMGLDVPRDTGWDSVLSEMLTATTPVTYGGSGEMERPRGDGYSEEEEAKVVERLKDLGYIS